MYIGLNGIGKRFISGSNEFWALKDITLDIDKSQIVTVLGPSGSGKSTMLNILGGIERPSEGSFFIDNIDVSKMKDDELTEYRRDKVGFVFQFYNLIPNLTVYENVEVTVNISKNPLDIDSVLSSVGMLDKKNKFPSELSGGEQQRVSIARAIVKNPDILLFDEPTGALDYLTSREILKLIENINKEYKTTMIVITHNTAISAMADRIIRLRSGELIENRLNTQKTSAEEVEW